MCTRKDIDLCVKETLTFVFVYNLSICPQIIDTHPGQQSDPLWRELQVLEQTQCGHESDLYPGAVKSFAILNLTVTSGKLFMVQQTEQAFL